MERGHEQLDHREYEDLLAAAALGTLTPEEHAFLAEHLEGCALCRSAFGDLLAVADALPLQVEPLAPSPALRLRLLEQVEPESITAPQQAEPAERAPVPIQQGRTRAEARGLPRTAWALTIAAMLVLALLSGIAVDRWVLPEPADEVRTIALQYPGTISLNDATLTWAPEQDLLQFSADDLPAPPDGMVYQVWLFHDDVPLPFGTVNPDTGEYVARIDRDRYATFAITLEPGPLGSPSPTSDVLVLASLGNSA